MPARSAIGSFEPIADLDAIVEKPKAIKLNGQWHLIKALDVEEFMLYLNEAAALFALNENKTMAQAEKTRQIADACVAVFRRVLPDLSKKEINAMSFQQTVAMFGHIARAVTGDVSGKTVEQIDGVEKKSLIRERNSEISA